MLVVAKSMYLGFRHIWIWGPARPRFSLWKFGHAFLLSCAVVSLYKTGCEYQPHGFIIGILFKCIENGKGASQDTWVNSTSFTKPLLESASHSLWWSLRHISWGSFYWSSSLPTLRMPRVLHSPWSRTYQHDIITFPFPSSLFYIKAQIPWCNAGNSVFASRKHWCQIPTRPLIAPVTLLK